MAKWRTRKEGVRKEVIRSIPLVYSRSNQPSIEIAPHPFNPLEIAHNSSPPASRPIPSNNSNSTSILQEGVCIHGGTNEGTSGLEAVGHVSEDAAKPVLGFQGIVEGELAADEIKLQSFWQRIV